ncbi:MAG: DUF1343 domain-containing protein [Planctomycetaceae bacterium]
MMLSVTHVTFGSTGYVTFAVLLFLNSTILEAQDGVLCGVDVLQRDGFKQLAGQRVGLITNHTGLTRDGISTVTLLHEAPDVELTTLFSPEHGFEGKLDIAKVGNATDASTGLRVLSLYGETRRPTAEMLQNVDVVVFDIQDIGTRFYTYISTMGEAMHACGEHHKRFVVLDRPNPINGVAVAGPMLDDGEESFVGFHSLPIRHGMTTGELALMFQKERGLELQLDVIRCEGWHRDMFFDATGLVWTNPSPNMRCLTQALLYPGIGMVETSNISVGRGTDTPFEVVGAPWIQPRRLAAELNGRNIPGVAVVPIRFRPVSSKYADELCGGLNFIVTDRKQFEPLVLGFHLASALQSLYPNEWKGESSMRLLGHRSTLDAILSGQSVSEIQRIAESEIGDFQTRRRRFLLY